LEAGVAPTEGEANRAVVDDRRPLAMSGFGVIATMLVGLCAVGLIAGLVGMDYLDEQDHRRWMARQRRRRGAP
jgi:hypothetical protein